MPPSSHLFWTAYVFGAFLIYTGYRMAFRHGEQTPPDRNPVVRLVRRVIPTDAAYHGDRFFSTFIVWTANAFAVLGLRSLYFCLAGLLRRFVHLHYGLAVLLAFAGVKLILSETPVGKLPIPVTLGVIVVTIAVSIGWSLRSTRGRNAPTLPLLYRPDGTVTGMGTARERILDAAEELITAGDVPPALDAVAAAAGVSKGGLLYHFDKQSLLRALVIRAVHRFDERLTAAAAQGTMAAAWLRLSVPAPAERTVYRAIMSMMRLTTTGELDLPVEVAEAEQRWQRMLTAELGDPVRARLVRLAGDGLLMAALTGPPPTPAEVEQLLHHLGLRS